MRFQKITKVAPIGIVILGSLLIMGLSMDLFGYRLYIDKSGSMQPKIQTGSLILDKTDRSYAVGNIVTYQLPNSQGSITHRIIKIANVNGVNEYTLKGDANSTPDAYPVPKSMILGKVTSVVPYIGYAISWVKTLPGLIILVIVPAVIIVYQEMANIKNEIAKIYAARKLAVTVAKDVVEEVEEEERHLASRINKIKSKWGASRKIILLFLLVGLGMLTVHFTSSLMSSSVSLTNITISSGTYESDSNN